MTLRQRRVVGAEHEREMRERRRRPAERLVDENLPWRVRDVVFAAHDVRDPHQGVVDDDGVVVGRDAVTAHDDWIADDVGVKRHRAAHQVVERHDPIGRHPQPHRRRLPGLHAVRDNGRIERAAGAGVLRGRAGGQRRLTLGLEPFRRAEAVVGVATRDELASVCGVEIEPLALSVGADVATGVDALVPGEPEPAQIVLDGGFGGRGRALAVGVLDAQDVGAAVVPRQQPVEERRAGVADVQMAGRTGGEADSHRRRSGFGSTGSGAPHSTSRATA